MGIGFISTYGAVAGIILWELDLHLPMGPSWPSSYGNWIDFYLWGCHGRRHLIVGYIFTYAISV